MLTCLAGGNLLIPSAKKAAKSPQAPSMHPNVYLYNEDYIKHIRQHILYNTFVYVSYVVSITPPH